MTIRARMVLRSNMCSHSIVRVGTHRHRIMATGMPGTTFYETTKRQKASSERSVLVDGFAGIRRTARVEAAGATKVGTQDNCVPVNQPHQEPPAGC